MSDNESQLKIYGENQRCGLAWYRGQVVKGARFVMHLEIEAGWAIVFSAAAARVDPLANQSSVGK